MNCFINLFSDKRHAYNWGSKIGCPIDRPMRIYTFDTSKMKDIPIFKLSALMEELKFDIPDKKAEQHIEVSNHACEGRLLTNISKNGYLCLWRVPAAAQVGEPELIEEDRISYIMEERAELARWREEQAAERAAAELEKTVKHEERVDSVADIQQNIKQEEPNHESEAEGNSPTLSVQPITSKEHRVSSPRSRSENPRPAPHVQLSIKQEPETTSEHDDDANAKPVAQSEIKQKQEERARTQTPEPESDDAILMSAPNTQQRVKRQRDASLDSEGDETSPNPSLLKKMLLERQ
jgi:hypothetical protein